MNLAGCLVISLGCGTSALRRLATTGGAEEGATAQVDPAYAQGPPRDVGRPSDIDRVGALDVGDLCPVEPESRNGFEDFDGCPDEIPADLVAALASYPFEDSERRMLDVGVVSEGLARALDRVAAVMRRYPDVRIEVSAHEAAGSPDHGRDPTSGWATMAKRLLVERGVDATRVFTYGAGETEPVDTNRTADGRRRNQRFDFTLSPP